MRDHAQHTTQYIGCESCVAEYVAQRTAQDRRTLTGIQRTILEGVRERVTIDDGDAYFAALERRVVGEVS